MCAFMYLCLKSAHYDANTISLPSRADLWKTCLGLAVLSPSFIIMSVCQGVDWSLLVDWLAGPSSLRPAGLSDPLVSPASDRLVSPVSDRLVSPLSDRLVSSVSDWLVSPLSDRLVSPVSDWLVSQTGWSLLSQTGWSLLSQTGWSLLSQTGRSLRPTGLSCLRPAGLSCLRPDGLSDPLVSPASDRLVSSVSDRLVSPVSDRPGLTGPLSGSRYVGLGGPCGCVCMGPSGDTKGHRFPCSPVVPSHSLTAWARVTLAGGAPGKRGR